MTLRFCFLTTHIYIFVKDVAQFLNHTLPTIDCLGQSSSATSSRHGHRPRKVERWSDFLNDTKEYILDHAEALSAPMWITHKAWNEAGVNITFNVNVISNIHSNIFIQFFPKIKHGGKYIVEGSQTPRRRMEIPLFFFSKTKTHWNIHPEDIIQQYQDNIMEETANQSASTPRSLDILRKVNWGLEPCQHITILGFFKDWKMIQTKDIRRHRKFLNRPGCS